MKAARHHLSLPGAMLARAFWLYVWEVTDQAGKEWLYVGRTGDSHHLTLNRPSRA